MIEKDFADLNRAFSARGYIVFAARGEYALIDYRPGDRTQLTHGGKPIPQPFFIICETDRKDWQEHLQAMGITASADEPRGRRYWRAGTD